MRTKTCIGFALFIALFAIQAQATPIMENLTTSTDLFVDDFEGVTANPNDYVDGVNGFAPVASVGAWENTGSPDEIQVTTYATPGPFDGSQYLRLHRSGTDFAIGGFTSQSTPNDQLHFELAINLEFGAEVRILGNGTSGLNYNTQDFIRLSFTSTELRYQNSAGTIVDSGITNYAKNKWGILTIDYTIGASDFSVGYEGQTATNLSLTDTLSTAPTSVDGFVVFARTGDDYKSYIDSIPEPASLGLFALFSGAALFIRKKFMI